MVQKIIKFFDKLEDRTRAKLSRKPLLYAFLGGIGLVLFWRGVWHTTDFFTEYLFGNTKISLYSLLDGPISFALGTSILLVTGVYVSSFIGNRLIISGLTGEKKLAEKTEDEVLNEGDEIKNIKKTLTQIEKELEELNHDKTSS